MAEQFQSNNPNSSREIINIQRFELGKIIAPGFGPPPKKPSITPEDLLNNGILVECQIESMKWGDNPNCQFIKDKDFCKIYTGRVNSLGLNAESINDKQWQALSKVAFPVQPLNLLEQEAIERFLRLIADKVLTIGVSFILAWLVLRKRETKSIYYTFNSEGGDILIGTADYSKNFYLSTDQPLNISNDILADKAVNVDLLAEEPPPNILKRPVLLFNNGEKTIKIPLSNGYVCGDAELNYSRPVKRTRTWYDKFLALFQVHHKPNQNIPVSPLTEILNGLPLEQNPEIAEMYLHYSHGEKTYTSSKCLLVIEENPYILVNANKIALPYNIAIELRENLHSKSNESRLHINDKQINSELGAIYLNGIPRKKWKVWLRKILKNVNEG